MFEEEIVVTIIVALLAIAFLNLAWRRLDKIEGPKFPKPALVVAVIAGFFLIVGITHFLFVDSDPDFWRTIFYFAATTGAVVTFVTAVWRGTIADRQAEQQRLQLNANERATIARDFAEATQMISFGYSLAKKETDEEKAKRHAKDYAGLALLYSVGTNDNSDFGRPVAVIMRDYITGHSVVLDNRLPHVEAYHYLDEISRRIGEDIFLGKTEVTGAEFKKLRLNTKLKVAKYYQVSFDADGCTTLANLTYEECIFYDGRFGDTAAQLEGDTRFVACKFKTFALSNRAVSSGMSIEYDNCIFIGSCQIPLVKSTFSSCRFDPRNPPHDRVFDFVKKSGGELQPMS